jgi:gluconolactonase
MTQRSNDRTVRLKSWIYRGAIMAMTCAVPHAQSVAPNAIEKLDSALDVIVAADARVELLKEDYFGLTEGPVWVPEGPSGYLLFSDIAANRIYKWMAGELSVFLENSGFTGKDPSAVGLQINNGRLVVILLGSNGLTLDPEGHLVLCALGDRAVKRREKDGTLTVLADRYEGKRFGGPNDLVIRSDGALYFTDSISGLRGGRTSASREIPFTAFYLLKDGQLQALDKEPLGGNPNGIALSPDEKYLYVTAHPKILRYEVKPDGTVANRQVFIDMSGSKAPGAADGMKVDRNGNVYSTGPGGIWIISPDGKHLGTIHTPVTALNLAFGDADGKTLYVTARRDLYRIRLNVPGVRPAGRN